MTYSKDDKNKEVETVPKKVYLIIDNQKHYIDPEIVKKYKLDEIEGTFFSDRKLYIDED